MRVQVFSLLRYKLQSCSLLTECRFAHSVLAEWTAFAWSEARRTSLWLAVLGLALALLLPATSLGQQSPVNLLVSDQTPLQLSNFFNSSGSADINQNGHYVRFFIDMSLKVL